MELDFSDARLKPVSSRVSVSDYDYIKKLASKHKVSMSKIMSSLLRQAIETSK